MAVRLKKINDKAPHKTPGKLPLENKPPTTPPATWPEYDGRLAKYIP
jgi:hypothetical protein